MNENVSEEGGFTAIVGLGEGVLVFLFIGGEERIWEGDGRGYLDAGLEYFAEVGVFCEERFFFL